MSKRHFLLYDFILPILFILAAGRFLSDQFDTALFRWADSIKAFGIGPWFSHSSIRQTLWSDSWLLFASAPALLWLAWFRVNVEYDYVERCRRLDRPLYTFFRGLFRWIDGTDASKWQIQSLQFRLAQAEDRTRKLETDLLKARAACTKLEAELEAAYDDLEGQATPAEGYEDEYQSGSGRKAG